MLRYHIRASLMAIICSPFLAGCVEFGELAESGRFLPGQYERDATGQGDAVADAADGGQVAEDQSDQSDTTADSSTSAGPAEPDGADAGDTSSADPVDFPGLATADPDPTATDNDDNQDEQGLPPLPSDAVLQTSETGLQTYDFEAGDGDVPGLDAKVVVDYVGYLEDGTIFDSGEEVSFGLGNVVDGFAEGISTMNVGGRRRLIIPPALGYGSGGNPRAGIGGEDNIIFDVTLHSFEPL